MSLQDELVALARELADDAREQLRFEPGARIAVRVAEVYAIGFVHRLFARYPFLHSFQGGIVLTPYPINLDVGSFLTEAMLFFRGQGDKAKIVHHSWNAAGYGLGKFIPDAAAARPSFAAHPSFATCSDAECADIIESALAAPKAGAVGAMDWSELLALAVQAALKILQQFFGT